MIKLSRVQTLYIYIQDHLAGPSGSRAIPLFLTMPRRVYTSLVFSAACSLVKQLVRRMYPCLRKCSFLALVSGAAGELILESYRQDVFG